MSMLGKIRRLYFREKLSISEIARRTSLSRNTIKKWLASDPATEPKYRRRKTDTKLTPYEGPLQEWLAADTHRPKRDRRTALVLYGELRKLGFPGSYTRVSEYVRRWREAGFREVGSAAFVPLKFTLGEAFQFDWSEEGMVVGGLYRRLQVAHIKLCASRAFLLVAYPTQGQEMLFDAHSRAFRVFGGVPRRGIYDNMKTAVDKVGKGKARVINSRFNALTAHYLFDVDFCNVASGWEKGQVEKNIQDRRRHLWQEASQTQFSSLTELNECLESRCRESWIALSHPECAALSVADALELEQSHLMPMPPPFDGYIEWVARVSSTCLVTVYRNRYSIPCRFANQKVSVRLYAQRIEAYADDERIAKHERLVFDRDQICYDWQHYLPLLQRKPGALRNGAPFAELPVPLQRLKTALLRRPGGDRVMVEVLCCVPRFGLEAVQVAVELVLESSNTSLEHVRNVLSRLHDPAPSARLENTLQLKEEPIANTGRYDALHTPEADHV